MNVYLIYLLICEKRAEIDGIKILLVGDVPDAHLVHRAMPFKLYLRATSCKFIPDFYYII